MRHFTAAMTPPWRRRGHSATLLFDACVSSRSSARCGKCVTCRAMLARSAVFAGSAFRDMQKKITFHICDSFEGLSEPTAKDAPQGDEPAGRIKARDYRCSEADVRAHLAEFDFFEFHKGWI